MVIESSPGTSVGVGLGTSVGSFTGVGEGVKVGPGVSVGMEGNPGVGSGDDELEPLSWFTIIGRETT